MNETVFQFIVITIFTILGIGLGFKLRKKRKEKYAKKNSEKK